MDNQKIGNFIAELRREKGMTQKELAEKLNVTDKAVSKWERGAGYPEVTMIPILADTLGVTAGELLFGERTGAKEKAEKDTSDYSDTDLVVTDVIEYAKQSNEYKSSKGKAIALTILTFAFLIAIFVCMLCNYVIDKTFSWSLYVVGSEVTAWLVLYPFFAMKRRRFTASLIALSITIMPLLMLIEYLCPVKNWVFPFALLIVMVSLGSLWLTVILFSHTRISRWYLVSFVFIIGMIDNYAINGIVSRFYEEPVDSANSIIIISCAFIAFLLAAIGYIKKKTAKDRTF